MTKRKVTDLLPSEAILISSDAERNTVLDLMDNAGFVWNSGERANYAFIRNKFPYALAYKFNGNDGFPNRGIRIVDLDYDGDVTFYPATEFIQTESDEVEVSKFDRALKLLKDLADLQNGAPIEQHRTEWEQTMDEVYTFLNQHKTRNTPNQ